MEILKAEIEDLEKIEKIYSDARAFMSESGNPTQWQNGYPQREILLADIDEKKLYKIVNEDLILGVFYYAEGVDPTYEKIYFGKWKNDLPYAVIHRIAVSADARGMGVAALCFDFAFKKCANLKIDTHKDNLQMQKALLKFGFEYCGIIHISNGDERIAFQKVK